MVRQAVILVGGLGTRLNDRTRNTPKPMLDVGGQPFLDYLVDEVARHGFTDIVLLAGHLGDQVEARYQNCNWRESVVRVLREPEPLGTGGALRFALPHLDAAFLLANGDTFFDINLRALTEPDIVLPDGIVMGLCSGIEGNRFGRVRFSNGLVHNFHAPEEGVPGPINGGISCIGRSVIESLPDGKFSLEGAKFPELARQGRIRGKLFDGYFIDIGVPEDFMRADAELRRRLTRPALFFDRDGVLNKDTCYTHRIGDFVWMEGAKDAIRLCNDHGVLVFVVTNQAGVAHGYYDESAVRKLHAWMNDDLAEVGAHIDAFEFCAHHPQGKVEAYRGACRRRKPAPGMILDILSDWRVDVSRSFLIGDKQSDVAAAQAAGIDGMLFADTELDSMVKTQFAIRNICYL